MRNRQASVVFVLITLFMDILGMGLVIPILPRLVQRLVGGTVGEASFVFGLLVSIYSVMQFFCAPVLGALSDRFGRRPVILVALAGLGLDYVLLSVAPSIWWLVLGRSSLASAAPPLHRPARTSPMSVRPRNAPRTSA
jgi:MFS transporter, DHA1 family, tetracycline resistance protein